MARLILVGFSCFAISLSPCSLLAQHEVTLKGGTRIIGSAALERSTVVVTIGKSPIAVPLADVELIAPVGVSSPQSPDRLLMIALESQMQHGSSEALVGLLAEAARQAPDDPRVAYWYARSLVDGGFGSAAQRVFEAHGDGIVKAYPGLAERLMMRIRERVAMENLPSRLISRIDRWNAAAEGQLPREGEARLAARFRVVDDRGRTVDSSAVSVEANGRDEQLESFDNGYFLFSYVGQRESRNNQPKLIVQWTGLETKRVDLRLASDAVEDAGQFVVHRFAEQDKRSVRILVVDRRGEPITGAQVLLRTMDRANAEAQQFTKETSSGGRAEYRVFPMEYAYTVQAKGFQTVSGGVTVATGESPVEEQRVELYPAVSGSMRVVWTSALLQPPGVTTSGEATIDISDRGSGRSPFDPNSATFLRTMQQQDRMMLLIGGPPYMVNPNTSGEDYSAWVRKAPGEKGSGNAADDVGLRTGSAQKQFADIDLKKIDQLKDKFSTPKQESSVPGTPYGVMGFQVRQGDVYVGKLPHRDMRTGQPTLVKFKILIEELSSPEEPEQ